MIRFFTALSLTASATASDTSFKLMQLQTMRKYAETFYNARHMYERLEEYHFKEIAKSISGGLGDATHSMVGMWYDPKFDKEKKDLIEEENVVENYLVEVGNFDVDNVPKLIQLASHSVFIQLRQTNGTLELVIGSSPARLDEIVPLNIEASADSTVKLIVS